MPTVQITRIHDAFLIKKGDDSDFFTTTKSTIVMSQFNFLSLLKFMLIKGFIKTGAIEAILEEVKD